MGFPSGAETGKRPKGGFSAFRPVRGNAFFRVGAILLLLLTGRVAVFGETDEEFKKKKSQIFVEKALKAEKKGKIDEAAEAFEDAYEAYPSNVQPLLLWGEVLARVGLYGKAHQVLKKVPIASLPPGGQCRVHLLFGKIALASGAFEPAANSLRDALKANGKSQPARIRLSMLNLILGLPGKASELMADLQGYDEAGYRDRAVAFLLDIDQGNFLRALENCSGMAESLGEASFGEDEPPALLWLWQIGPLFFLAGLPLGLSGFFGLIYLGALLGGLAFLAHRFSPPGPFLWTWVFLFLGVLHVGSAYLFGIPPVRVAALLDGFSLPDPIWILPRLLCGIHFVSLALFLIFPAFFKFLPETMQPRRYELFGIWFFTWWFMSFVLVFQSKLAFTARWVSLFVTFVLTAVSAACMPLGRYLLFLTGKSLGVGKVELIAAKSFSADGKISFTDAKIHEAETVRQLDSEAFSEVISGSRKLFSRVERKSFPALWVAYLKSLLETDDIFEAERCIPEFVAAMQNTSYSGTGLLLSAFLKTLQGDNPGVFSLINSIPESRAKAFSAEEAGLSLWLLGRCNRAFSQLVQAHIDFSKILQLSVSPLLKAKTLLELTEMDTSMNRPEWVDKWGVQARELKGGSKTMSYVLSVEATISLFQGRKEDALKLVQSACGSCPQNSRSVGLQGQILCSLGKFNEAEALLEKLVAGSVEAEKLIQRITSKS